MRRYAKNIFTLLVAAFISALPSVAYGECSAGPTSCEKAFSSCKPEMKNGIYSQTSRSGISSSCIKEKTSNGCFNSLPVSWGDSYNSIGYRPNGAGGNSKPRNHYGSYIGGGGKTDIVVSSAADGVVKYVKTSGGGGRTIAIEHDMKCSGGGVYKTTYRHLLSYKVNVGDTVTKDQPIGIEGGSNAKSQGAQPCDHPNQRGMPGFTREGCGSNYAIHLHFEVKKGPVSSATTQATPSNVIEPYCGGLQALCGDCPADATECLGRGISPSGTGIANDGSYVAASSSGNSEGSASGKSSNKKGCSLAGYMNSDDCVFCELFKKIFNAASTIAKTANDKLSIPSRNVVAVGFMIWLAIFILKSMATFQAANSGDILKGILFQGFRVLVVSIILTSSLYQVMDLTLNPVMQTGLEFSQSLNTTSTCNRDAPYMQKIMGYDAKKGYQANSNGGLSIDLGASILCSIKNLEDSVSVLSALGSYSMCIGIHRYALWDIIPHLGYISSGAVLWIAGTILLLSFPWALIDCILQLCIAAAMIPCGVAAYAFKITAKYITIIWNFFMNAMFNIVFLSVVIYIINSKLFSWIGLEILDDGTPSVRDQIFIYPFGDGLAWYGVGAFKVFAICFLCWGFFDEAKEMAQTFANGASLGGSKGIGRMVGGTVAQAAKKAAVGNLGENDKNGNRQGVGGLLGVVGKAGNSVGEALNNAYGNQVRSGINKMKGKALKAMGGKELKDANGNTVGYEKSFNFLGFKQTRTVTQDANGMWTQEKETHVRSKVEKAYKEVQGPNGEKTYMDTSSGEIMTKRVDEVTGNIIYETADGKSRLITDKDGKMLAYKRKSDIKEKLATINGGVKKINDGFMKSRIVTDSKGNVIGVDTQFKDSVSKYLVNKDGTINMNAYNQIMANAQDKKLAAAAMVNMAMQQRDQGLNNRFKSRDVQIDKNGNITINQLNNDGSKQTINAKMINGQMVIQNETQYANGDMVTQTSNGIMSKTESATLKKDGTYKIVEKYSFSDHVHNTNKVSPPLDKDGVWGYRIDANQAMTGFDSVDFDKHISQIRSGRANTYTSTHPNSILKQHSAPTPQPTQQTKPAEDKPIIQEKELKRLREQEKRKEKEEKTDREIGNITKKDQEVVLGSLHSSTKYDEQGNITEMFLGKAANNIDINLAKIPSYLDLAKNNEYFVYKGPRYDKDDNNCEWVKIDNEETRITRDKNGNLKSIYYSNQNEKIAIIYHQNGKIKHLEKHNNDGSYLRNEYTEDGKIKYSSGKQNNHSSHIFGYDGDNIKSEEITNEKGETVRKEYNDGRLVKYIETNEKGEKILKSIDDRDQSILEAGRNRASHDTRRHQLFGISNITIDGLEYPDEEAIKEKSLKLQSKVNNRFALDTTIENK